jgi:hypothetical protein|tara:strand:- start:2383 stop:2547 length:165 start_codon:yes stop_codon:yes gene_type:complete
MAKIHEEILIIKFSKLIKETDQTTPISSLELISSLAAVAEELAGTGVIVEVEQA